MQVCLLTRPKSLVQFVRATQYIRIRFERALMEAALEDRSGSLQSVNIQSRIHYDMVEPTCSLVRVVDVLHPRENSSEV
jgi:hypothetical protein